MAELWSALQQPPFGLFPAPITAVLLGFLTKDLCADHYWSDGTSCFPLNQYNMAELPLKVLKEQRGCQDIVIRKITRLAENFCRYVREFFTLPQHEGHYPEELKGVLWQKLQSLGYPLWGLGYLRTADEYAPMVKAYLHFLQCFLQDFEAASEGITLNEAELEAKARQAIANWLNGSSAPHTFAEILAIINLLSANEPVRAAVQRTITPENLAKGMEQFIADSHPELAQQLRAQGLGSAWVVRTLRELLQEEVWLLQEEVVQKKLPEVYANLVLLAGVNRLCGLTEQDLAAARDRCKNEWLLQKANPPLRFWAGAGREAGAGERAELYRGLDRLMTGQPLPADERARLGLTLQRDYLAVREDLAEQAEVLSAWASRQWGQPLSVAEARSILADLPNLALETDDQKIQREILARWEQVQHRKLVQEIQELWEQATDTASPTAWSRQQRLPIGWVLRDRAWQQFCDDFARLASLPDELLEQYRQKLQEEAEALHNCLREAAGQEWVRVLLPEYAEVVQGGDRLTQLQEYLVTRIGEAVEQWPAKLPELQAAARQWLTEYCQAMFWPEVQATLATMSLEQAQTLFRNWSRNRASASGCWPRCGSVMARVCREVASVEDLQRELREDAQHQDRWPTRFILVSGLASWRQVLQLLRGEATQTICQSSFCQTPETLPFIPWEKLAARFKGSETSRTLLLPVSELLRLHEDLGGGLLRSLAVLEYPSRSRCYVPLWQAEDLFARQMRKVNRWQAGELPPTWSLGGRSDELQVLLTGVPVQAPSGYEAVQGIKPYLELWEQGGPSQQRILLISEYAQGARSISGRVELRVCRRGYEVVKEFLADADTLAEEWGTAEQWRWLAGAVVPGKHFSAAARLLNVQHFAYPEIFQNWPDWPEEQRWLLWLWSKIELPGKYARVVLEGSRDYRDFPEKCWTRIFAPDLPWEDDLLWERRCLLEYFRPTDPPAAFWGEYQALPDSLKKLKLLTGLTRREKQEAITLTGKLLKQEQPLPAILAALNLAYRELAWYLGPLSINDPPSDRLDRYLLEYKKSRILNEPTALLFALAQELGKDYLCQFPARHAVLEKMRDKACPEVWIDGLGVEWLSFLEHSCRDCHIQVEAVITQANLPSITAANKDRPEQSQVLRELDNLAHSYDYQYPQSLVQEIDIIAAHLQESIALLESAPQVILTADHGLSLYLFHQAKDLTPPAGAAVDQWSWCAKIREVTSDIAAQTDWRVAGEYLCLRGFGRFQGGARARGEIHGGANLEEALVPVVVLRRRPQEGRLAYDMQLTTAVVRFDIERSGVLEVRIHPDPGALQLHTWDFRVIGGQRLGLGRYEFRLTDLQPGDFEVRFATAEGMIGAEKIKVISAGLEEEDLGI